MGSILGAREARRPPLTVPPRGRAEPRPWRELFPDATEAEWNDWRWQARRSIRTLEELERFVSLTEDERAGVVETASIFKLAITPYYLTLIDPEHPFCPVRRQAIPSSAEARVAPGELADPLGEDLHRPVTSIVHKYPDRVLLLALDRCSVYCRHCTRRRITGQPETEIDRSTIAEAVDYLHAHPEVRDVLISGGDPFLLATSRLDELLGAIRAVPHVQMIRIGTRVPVCTPMRVDDELCRVLRKHAPVFVVTHFNHPKELTADSGAACERLVDHGVPVENQAVLMRRINSDARILTDLSHRLLERRVRPYYLHQMDVAEGLEHLRTPIRTGVDILEKMRGWTTGLAIPHLAVDLPGGGGKVTLSPQYAVEFTERETTFRNYRGERYRYPEPVEQDVSCPYDEVFYSGS
ncbi:KamA family radical SAM protein [Vulgatibacter incomptus]|uniref:KamA family radical SAM protein n=1 Tax=Vulgatibacter incomptus TaxID=1391653 RepID=UPI003B833A54